MNKFDGNWTEERTKDLIIAHKNRNHRETALNLSQKWNLVVTRDVIKNKYNSLNVEKITTKVLNAEPNKSREFYDKVQDDSKLKDKRIYFITSAIAGCSLNENFFKSIQNFIKDRNAKLVVFPMKGIGNKDEEYNDDVIKNLEQSFYTEYIFNNNIEGLDIGASPTQINPLAGLERIADRTSVIISSPKQNMVSIPNSNINLPHILQSTGTVTNPSYSQNRIGLLASNDHVMGGIILEIENEEIFHFRQVQADKNGIFFDLDKMYSPDKISKAQADAFVWGDLHIGNHDEKAVSSWYEVMDLIKPKNIFLHDTIDAGSVNHHEQHNITARANRDEIFQTLKGELDYAANFIKSLTSKYKSTKFFAVRSNHDEHIDRYLNETRFVNDPFNYRVALQLAIYKLDGFNPVEKYFDSTIGKIKNLVWLKRDQDIKINGTQMAVHGDKGSNGSFGSVTGFEKAYNNCIIGHSHSPSILRDTFQVGTSTKLKLNYNAGASSWLHCSCLLYPTGQKTLIISIDGKWRI